jgi:hypothetical protein
MSKKKRLRRDLKRKTEFFIEAWIETVEDAHLFLETAKPFEISLQLAHFGVSTIDEPGMKKFLQGWSPAKDDPEHIYPFEALAEHWEKEIERKGADELDFYDSIFLTETARYFWEKIELHKNKNLDSFFSPG